MITTYNCYIPSSTIADTNDKYPIYILNIEILQITFVALR
jgi:hypothetical protein